MTGLIGFSTSKSFIAKAIKWFRKSQWSHTFVVIGKLHGELLVAEAGELNVRIMPLKRFLNKGSKMELWKIDLPIEDHIEAVLKIMPMVGRQYGWMQLLGFIWIWLWEKIGIKGKANPFAHGIICSEYVYYYLYELGYEGIKHLSPNETAPDHIIDGFRYDKKASLAASSDYGTSDIKWSI